MTVRRILVVLLLAVFAAPASALDVTGYAEDDLPAATLDQEAPALAEVGVDGVTLTRDGVHKTSPAARALLARTHADGLRGYLLVSNYSSRIGDFDPALAARMLRRPAPVARRLVRIARTQGWDGITVDLESLSRRDGPGLTRFVAQLVRRVPVSIDLMAEPSPGGYRAAGYELRALARHAEVLAVMAYDQHGPGWSGPGPIGALGWQRRCLAALLTAVPAAQVDLGVAGYGYAWPTMGDTISPAHARALAGDAATWDAAAGEWTATLEDGTVLWWADRRAYDLRAEMAAAAGLHGLAVWRLGSADSLQERAPSPFLR